MWSKQCRAEMITGPRREANHIHKSWLTGQWQWGWWRSRGCRQEEPSTPLMHSTYDEGSKNIHTKANPIGRKQGRAGQRKVDSARSGVTRRPTKTYLHWNTWEFLTLTGKSCVLEKKRSEPQDRRRYGKCQRVRWETQGPELGKKP